MNKQVLDLVEKLDEHEDGHADEAPRYVKNILARLRELPLHDREVWLKTIMCEFEQDFSRAKWREGYEQGKVEDLIEPQKVTIPQFVADWIFKAQLVDRFDLRTAIKNVTIDLYLKDGKKVIEWLDNDTNQETFARAQLDGYTVEVKRYRVNVKNVRTRQGTLNRSKKSGVFIFSNPEENNLYGTKFTRKELEDAGFGEVFNSPLFEVEEVE